VSGRRIDLHVHTTASDGLLSPSDTVQAARREGVWLLGVADHDTTEGVPEAAAAARAAGVTLVPGVELSVGSGLREIHVLGYFVDIEDEGLQGALARLRGARDARNERIVERLREMGRPVDLARVKEIAGNGSVGRPHIAAALLEAGHVSSLGEAFGRYLARGKPAYVDRERLEPAQASAVIKQAGGLAVLAHPAKIGGRQVIEDILDGGMEGVEVYHTDHTAMDVEMLLGIAKRRGLLVTGGTDSHGPHSEKPIAVGSLDIPEWVGDQFLAYAREASVRWGSPFDCAPSDCAPFDCAQGEQGKRTPPPGCRHTGAGDGS
jgi:predicted metal-dependent phosphoesterase TrpH